MNINIYVYISDASGTRRVRTWIPGGGVRTKSVDDSKPSLYRLKQAEYVIGVSGGCASGILV